MIVRFELGGLLFEYDENKNQINLQKHGISFRSAARVFFDYDRIEFFDEEHSNEEDRYNLIGNASVAQIESPRQMIGKFDDILFVVYTERFFILDDGKYTEVIRLISARMATNFERGLYYGKCE